MRHPGLQHQMRLKEAADRVANFNGTNFHAQAQLRQARQAHQQREREASETLVAAERAREVLSLIANAQDINDFGLPLVRDATASEGWVVPPQVRDAFPEIMREIEAERERRKQRVAAQTSTNQPKGD